MANYFSYFPQILYDAVGKGDYKVVTNLLNRVVMKKGLKEIAAVFDTIDVQGEMTPEALDSRMIMLVAPAVEAMAYILGSADSNDMAKVSVSKFVMSTMYQRMVSEADVAPQAMKELRDALRVIK